MGILQTIRKVLKGHTARKKTLGQEECDRLRDRLTPLFKEAEEMDLTGREYYPLEEADEMTERWKEVLNAVFREGSCLQKNPGYLVLKQELDKLYELCVQLTELFRENNQSYARQQAMAYSAKLLPVEGRRLNFEQLCAIVKPARNRLLLAGAGTGKTAAIVGLVKYLFQFCNYAPEEILLLSFTRASAEEMERRISRECGMAPETETFHKLGLTIISAVEGKKPGIQTESLLETTVRENLNRMLLSPWYRKLLLLYQLYAKLPEKSRMEFHSEQEYEEYLRWNPPVTVAGERVKSYAEVQIANFLFQYGISYYYEAAYEVDTKTEHYAQYHPDFYLPDYEIYIEHFGIDREGKVADYFTSKDGKSPSQAYLEAMEWKRRLHRRHKTKLVETYYYEYAEGTLLKQLKHRLEDCGVVFVEQEEKILWKQLMEQNHAELSSLERLFVTVIEQMESSGLTEEDARKRNESRPFTERIANRLILKLVAPLRETYLETLRQRGEVDFNEMLRRAAAYVREQKFSHKYRMVIVDEYQDISDSRFELLFAMREQKDFRLFVAGDDWQSIYRFAGCEIGHILRFEQEWGISEKEFLKTTYRFSDAMAELSRRFILKNPSQLPKKLEAAVHRQEPAVEFLAAKSQLDAIGKIPGRLLRLPENSRVFFLGRYLFDKELLLQIPEFDSIYHNSTGQLEIIYEKRTDLKITFLTIHKSKGLQADYVFLLNNLKSGRGFPATRQNPSILKLFGCEEDYPAAEERRLFYVALTRARYQTFLVLEKGNVSPFAEEIKELLHPAAEPEVCPLCGGTLLLRKGPYGSFYGCSNYASEGCGYTRRTQEEGDSDGTGYTRKNRHYSK